MYEWEFSRYNNLKNWLIMEEIRVALFAYSWKIIVVLVETSHAWNDSPKVYGHTEKATAGSKVILKIFLDVLITLPSLVSLHRGVLMEPSCVAHSALT